MHTNPPLPENLTLVARRQPCAVAIFPDGALHYAPVWGISLAWQVGALSGEAAFICACGSHFTTEPPCLELVWEYIHSPSYKQPLSMDSKLATL